MYVSMSRLRVPAERADELVAAFRRRIGLVDGFEGSSTCRSGSPTATRAS
jgi:heme-degrading monooxygenase HmoA